MKAAIRDPDPVVFLENELLYGTAFDVEDAVMESDFILPIGKAKIQRAGTDISLVAHSIGVGFAMDAAEILAKEGISCEVIKISCENPLQLMYVYFLLLRLLTFVQSAPWTWTQ